ncbi:MAG: glycosyltransferase family 1 protein, partial [Anaerolineae bacterium]
MSVQRLNEIRKELESVGEGRLFGGESIQLSNIATQIAPVKRVAIFAEAFLPKLDGVSKSAYLTLQYLEKTGREVMIFAPDFAPTQVSSSRVVPLRSFGMPFAPETRVGLMPNPGVGRLLDEFQPDLIHLFSPALLGVNGLVAGLNRKIPVIANYQTDLPGYTEHYGLNILGKGLRDWLRTLHNR